MTTYDRWTDNGCKCWQKLTWPLASELIQNYLLSAKKNVGNINLFKNIPFLKFNHHFIVNRCSADYNKSISLILHVIYNTDDSFEIDWVLKKR